MDLGVILGYLSGIGLILFGCVDGGGSLLNFYSLSSIAVVVGGTLAATVISTPISTLKNVPKHMRIIFKGSKNDPMKYIDKIIDYAQEARRKGFLALEQKAEGEEDEFLKKCIMLIVDAIEPTMAKEILENDLDCLEERHSKGWAVYEKAASVAPAFGMIGTLMGLINMLKQMGDLSSGNAASGIGSGMSLALITTFYGSILANLILMPMANRLKARHEQEMICKQIIVDGVLAIHAGTNPRHIEEKLKAYVSTISYNKKNKGKQVEDEKE